MGRSAEYIRTGGNIGDSGLVYARDKHIDRDTLFPRGALQRIPEYWLKADRGLMPGNGDAVLDRPRERVLGQMSQFVHDDAARTLSLNTYVGRH